MLEKINNKLIPKYGATRRGVLMLWIFSSSLFLYYFALASGISQENLYFGYLNFSALLFGGGISYHVLIELLKIEQNKENESKWKILLKYLLILQAGYIFAGAAIYLGFLLGKIGGFLLAMIGMVCGLFWVLHFLAVLMKKIESLFGVKLFGRGKS
ncbi:TPA: hypothetical protein ACPHWC_006980 [Pseudomonas aeruginosa]|uniref:hypothetical protein n=1 Tax=Pseudomonas aeruginosa TaxID=287 RepID=UPI000AB6B8F7|nr:hypothetical protein [Pseudomonas aeruginosa]EIU5455900.1 hypothetical protein [Pseudomonas aeruginosa]EIU5460588.1 hypothetical protein [Pseudomonas aeruginosa]EIU5542816.1 hypothetical protein [Pseudomonas aeruginosa]EKW4493117.1 hypothetical protein [Pseudomonas aeruginosa]EKW4494783.1 hypothetical protein [Pseudomonas aeruginosa]